MSTYLNIFKLFLLPLRSDFLKGFLLFAVQNTGHLNLCLPLTCCRSMVFSEHCGFLHQYNWPSRFNWNIVSSGITHHNSNPWFLPSVMCNSLLTNVVSVVLRYKAYDFSFGIFKLFLWKLRNQTENLIKLQWYYKYNCFYDILIWWRKINK